LQTTSIVYSLKDAQLSKAPTHPDDRRLAQRHWAVLRALELGDFPLVGLSAILDELLVEGLIERSAHSWHLTDEGRTLVALRRHI
jgi:hypothetical protein